MGEQSRLYITEVNTKLDDLKSAFSELATAKDNYADEWKKMASARDAGKPGLFRDRLQKYCQSCVSSEAKTLTALGEADKSLKKFQSFLTLKAREWNPLKKKSLSSCQEFVTESRTAFDALKKEIDQREIAKWTKQSFEDGKRHGLF